MSVYYSNPQEDTDKCVFKSCRNTAAIPKPGLHFFMFNCVPRSIRNSWTQAVARERDDPSFEPDGYSMMCSEHFSQNEISRLFKLINRRKLDERDHIPTPLPTSNVGPCFSDLILIEDNDVQDASQAKDVVCIIENQIRTEPEPKIEEKKDIDLEDEIRFSLVGRTKQFEGLIYTSKFIEQNNENEDVVIIEDDKEIKNSENESEFVDQFSKFIKKRNEELTYKCNASNTKRKKLSSTKKNFQKKSLILDNNYQTISTSKSVTEAKNPGHTLQQLLTRTPPLPTKPIFLTTPPAQPHHVVAPQDEPTPVYLTKAVNDAKSQEPSIKEENDEDDDVIIVAEDIEFDVSDDECKQEYIGKYSKFLKKLNSDTPVKKKRWNSVEPKRKVFDNSKIEQNSSVATTQHNIPTSLVALQSFAAAPLLVASPMVTTQNGKAQQLVATTPIIATNAAQQLAAPQLVALIPSNVVKQNSMHLQNNNLQTYYLGSLVSTTPQLLIDSGQVVLKQKIEN